MEVQCCNTTVYWLSKWNNACIQAWTHRVHWGQCFQISVQGLCVHQVRSTCHLAVLLPLFWNGAQWLDCPDPPDCQGDFHSWLRLPLSRFCGSNCLQSALKMQDDRQEDLGHFFSLTRTYFLMLWRYIEHIEENNWISFMLLMTIINFDSELGSSWGEKRLGFTGLKLLLERTELSIDMKHAQTPPVV